MNDHTKPSGFDPEKFFKLARSVGHGKALGLEYRWLALDANFGPEFGGRTKVGGGVVLIGYRGALR